MPEPSMTGPCQTPGNNGNDNTAQGILRRLARYVAPPGDRRMRIRISLSLGCLVVAKLLSVLTPLLYGKIVDTVSRPAVGLSTLYWLLGAYGLARLSQGLFTELKEFLFVRVSQRAIRRAAVETFQHLHSLSLRFHLDRQIGGLTRAIDRGAKGIDFLLTLLVFEILPSALELVFAGAVLWRAFGFKYAAMTVGAIGIYVAFTITTTEWRVKFRTRLNATDEAAAAEALDSLLNYETIKSFNAEESEVRRYDAALRAFEDAAVRWRTSVTIVNFGQGAVIAAALVAVMATAGRDIEAGGLSVGQFVAINTYILQLYMPLGFLGYVYREMRSSLVDMVRMFSLFDEKPDVEDRPDALPLVIAGGEVEFDGVSFSYGGREVLSDISFRVKGGHKVGIVGASGAGKSSLVRLLLRLYDPARGTIRIDGQDIAAVTQASVRGQIGLVPQDTILFNDTIARNISFGRDSATRKEIEDAVQSAALDRLIDQLPDGYETRVGERGVKLSGGEKQRVAIARAILKAPEIMLLDEATSSLDSTTEREIQQSMRQVCRGRTTIVIAHRLSTVLDADLIIVLADGRIVEEGSHEALVERNGVYAAMWRRQQAPGDTEDTEKEGIGADSHR
jgi:ATP-binding cassette, subfamily B, heavy metal transporter